MPDYGKKVIREYLRGKGHKEVSILKVVEDYDGCYTF